MSFAAEVGPLAIRCFPLEKAFKSEAQTTWSCMNLLLKNAVLFPFCHCFFVHIKIKTNRYWDETLSAIFYL